MEGFRGVDGGVLEAGRGSKGGHLQGRRVCAGVVCGGMCVLEAGRG